MLPNALINACERNDFVWHRADTRHVDAAFDSLSLERRGEFFEFSRRYCLQFVSESMPFEMVDFVEEDGHIADLIDYAHSELGISRDLIPISTYEAEALFCVRPSDDNVLLISQAIARQGWHEELLSASFWEFMFSHL